jgi:hypothetical protein
MSGERWRTGWQEESFARVKGFVQSSPAWYQHLSPSDVAEDAYLLTIASSLFLRDGDGGGGQMTPAGRISQAEAAESGAAIGAPAFSYEKAEANQEDAQALFAQASAGSMGSLHRNAAKRAGSVEAWRSALKALQSCGSLHGSLTCEASRCSPRPATFQEDLNECMRAVLRKSLHAFKIGFGLWGRWEAP